MLIDSHCHLDPEYFPEGPGEVLARAKEAGVGHFVVIGVGEGGAAADQAVRLAGERDDVSATVGVHPHDAKGMDEALFERMRVWSKDEQVVAIGEVGLDYHYNHSPEATQQEVFRRFVSLAKERGKPIVIHTRSAPEDTLRILEEEDAREVGGIIHCFSEDRAFAARALDMDFDISFSGIVTFKNARAIQDVARWAPLGRVMVETDSPYLSPMPLRGKRNEPANIVHTARYVAELRDMLPEDFVTATGRNVARRFGLKLDLELASGDLGPSSA
jgi:TatD DNase family protein